MTIRLYRRLLYIIKLDLTCSISAYYQWCSMMNILLIMKRNLYFTSLLLQERGIRLAIGSSSKNARTILEKIELLHFFEVISDGINLVNPKPDPEVFLKASAALFLKPEDCIVVEDAKAGIDAALAGGFIAVGMGDAYTYEKNTYSIKELKELLLLVRTL